MVDVADFGERASLSGLRFMAHSIPLHLPFHFRRSNGQCAGLVRADQQRELRDAQEAEDPIRRKRLSRSW